MTNFDLTRNRETTTGPLDVAKSAGSELDDDFELDVHTDEREDEMADTPDDMRQKNRLGYTVTEPTEQQIDGAVKKGA